MAHVLAAFPEKKFIRKVTRTYPWDDWLDGRVWQLNMGFDFPNTPGVFRSQVYYNALQRGVSVRCMVLNERILVIQASTVAT
jgi:hypothetical protein